MNLVEFKAAFQAKDLATAAFRVRKAEAIRKLHLIGQEIVALEDPVSRALFASDEQIALKRLLLLAAPTQEALQELTALETTVQELTVAVRETAELGMPEDVSLEERIAQTEAWYTMLKKPIARALGSSLPDVVGLSAWVETFTGTMLNQVPIDDPACAKLMKRIEARVTLILNDLADREDLENRVRSLRAELEPRILAVKAGIAGKQYGTPPTPQLLVLLHDFSEMQTELAVAQAQNDLNIQEETYGKLADILDEIVEAASPREPELDGAVALRLNAEMVRDDEFELRSAYFILEARLFQAKTNADKRLPLAGALGVPADVKTDVQALVRGISALLVKSMVPKPDYAACLEAARVQDTLLTSIQQRFDLLGTPPEPAPPPSEALAKRRKKELDARVKTANGVLDRNLRATLTEVADAWVRARDTHQPAGNQAIRRREWEAALTAYDALEAAIDAVDEGIASHVSEKLGDLNDERANMPEMVALAARFGKASSNALRDVPNGTLDRMMDSLDGKADSDDKKRFTRQALAAKFQVEFAGKISAKAGPRLYGLLSQVPADHIKGNPALGKITRERPLFYEGSSFYQAKGKQIVLKAVRTGISDTVTGIYGNRLDQDPGVDEDSRIEEQLTPRFDAVALHEVGHAVDERDRFMQSRGSMAQYGGWITHEPAEVADRIALDKGFYGAFPDVEKPILRAYLLAVLQGQSGKKALASAQLSLPELYGDTVTREALMGDAGVQQAGVAAARLTEEQWVLDDIIGRRTAAESQITLGAPAEKQAAKSVIKLILSDLKPTSLSVGDAVTRVLASMRLSNNHAPVSGLDWGALEGHAATKLCEKVRMKGDNGIWDGGAARANECKLGDGRVYFESYKKEWVSYLFAARKKGVSSYQFRNKAEWYAELYATYYLGKLPQTHPMYGFFEAMGDQG